MKKKLYDSQLLRLDDHFFVIIFTIPQLLRILINEMCAPGLN